MGARTGRSTNCAICAGEAVTRPTTTPVLDELRDTASEIANHERSYVGHENDTPYHLAHARKEWGHAVTNPARRKFHLEVVRHDLAYLSRTV